MAKTMNPGNQGYLATNLYGQDSGSVQTLPVYVQVTLTCWATCAGRMSWVGKTCPQS